MSCKRSIRDGKHERGIESRLKTLRALVPKEPVTESEKELAKELNSVLEHADEARKGLQDCNVRQAVININLASRVIGWSANRERTETGRKEFPYWFGPAEAVIHTLVDWSEDKFECKTGGYEARPDRAGN